MRQSDRRDPRVVLQSLAQPRRESLVDPIGRGLIRQDQPPPAPEVFDQVMEQVEGTDGASQRAFIASEYSRAMS
jgi:hypothetical protein